MMTICLYEQYALYVNDNYIFLQTLVTTLYSERLKPVFQGMILRKNYL